MWGLSIKSCHALLFNFFFLLVNENVYCTNTGSAPERLKCYRQDLIRATVNVPQTWLADLSVFIHMMNTNTLSPHNGVLRLAFPFERRSLAAVGSLPTLNIQLCTMRMVAFEYLQI